MSQLLTIRCLQDNYAYLIKDMGMTVLIDAPEAAPILRALRLNSLKLDLILLTHHHDDHIQAVAELVAATGADVIGNAADAERLPPLKGAARAGQTLHLPFDEVAIIDVPGHTIGHIAYHFIHTQIVFTGDSLMSLGCGRLFEGDPAMMWASLMRLNALPPETEVSSGHDYCRINGAFALSVDPDNAALKQRLADIEGGVRTCAETTIADERATNPFLRAPRLAASLAMEGAPDVEVFARLREMRNSFTV